MSLGHERVNAYFSAPVTIWEQLRQWTEWGSTDLARSVQAFGTLFIGCSFILPSLPPTLACGREQQLKRTIKHPWKNRQHAEGGSKALRWMDLGGFWAGKSQYLIFMGSLNSRVPWTYESGEVSFNHQPWLFPGIHQSHGSSQTWTLGQSQRVQPELHEHNSLLPEWEDVFLLHEWTTA